MTARVQGRTAFVAHARALPGLPSVRPFLKWAGGKSQLLEVIDRHFPPALKEGRVKNYFEPFLGGGSVFFHVARHYPIRSARLFDVNEELVLTYRVVQERVDELVEYLFDYSAKYLRCGPERREKMYRDMRSRFNQDRFNVNYARLADNWVPRAAQVIFLNKTCFNGLFRVNRSGEFNVPIGRYVKPAILDELNLRQASKALSIAEIRRGDFASIRSRAKSGDFVYYDPPYRPLSATSNFKSYSKIDFNDGEQGRLAGFFRELHAKGVMQMLSNSDPKNSDPKDDFFDRSYAHDEFTLRRVPATRMINSNAAKRGRINELLITNY